MDGYTGEVRAQGMIGEYRLARHDSVRLAARAPTTPSSPPPFSEGVRSELFLRADHGLLMREFGVAPTLRRSPPIVPPPLLSAGQVSLV